MRISRTTAVVFTVSITLASFGLAACSSGTTSSEPSASAVMSDAPTEAADVEAAGGSSYCAPLADAIAIKPADGALDEAAAAAYGEALVPVADAATADGQQDLADMFTLMSQVYSDPNATNEQSGEVLNAVIANSDQINAECGIDLLQ